VITAAATDGVRPPPEPPSGRGRTPSRIYRATPRPLASASRNRLHLENKAHAVITTARTSQQQCKPFRIILWRGSPDRGCRTTLRALRSSQLVISSRARHLILPRTRMPPRYSNCAAGDRLTNPSAPTRQSFERLHGVFVFRGRFIVLGYYKVSTERKVSKIFLTARWSLPLDLVTAGVRLPGRTQRSLATASIKGATAREHERGRLRPKLRRPGCAGRAVAAGVHRPPPLRAPLRGPFSWTPAPARRGGGGRPRLPGSVHNVRTGRMIRLRRVAFLLPSALSKSLASSQSPYSAWSVRTRRAASRASRDVPRGKYTTR
jgi:hypothetical protein